MSTSKTSYRVFWEHLRLFCMMKKFFQYLTDIKNWNFTFSVRWNGY